MIADEEGFGEVVADFEHRALLLRAVQKGAGRFGLRGDLKIEDADDAPLGKHLIAADVQVHFRPPFRFQRGGPCRREAFPAGPPRSR